MARGRGMASRAITCLSALFIAAGIAALAYPAASSLLAAREQAAAAGEYAKAYAGLTDDDRLTEWEAAERYNASLAGDPVRDPFVVGSGYALPSDYEQVLDVTGDGTMAVLEIPSIGAYMPIYHGTSEDVLRKGAGHMGQTALPIGTVGGRPVITGHRGLPEAELFTRLDELDYGDTFRIGVLDRNLWYEVCGIEVIEPDEMEELTPVAGRDLVTLVTCTPYGVNTHRLLVTGERCDAPEHDGPSAGSVASDIPWQGYAAGAVVACTIGAVAYVVCGTRKRGR